MGWRIKAFLTEVIFIAPSAPVIRKETSLTAYIKVKIMAECITCALMLGEIIQRNKTAVRNDIWNIERFTCSIFPG